MQVYCPKCQKEVAAADLNMSHMVAKCASCHNLFNFADQVNDGSEWSNEASEVVDAPRPAKVKREHDGFNLVLSWRWVNYSLIFLIPFALFWNGLVFSFIGFSGMFALGAGEGFPSPMRMFPLFALPHFLIGIGLIYYIICLVVNQTKIRVSRSEVVVRHGPLPWWGSKTISARDINQLYTRERIGRGRNSSRASYEVHMIDQQSTHKKMITGLESAEYAFYIEQEIEKYLGIQDRPVRGAYG